MQSYGPAAVATSVRFSPDNRSLVTAHADGVAKVWDVATGGVRIRLGGQSQGGLRDALFSPDGNQVYTAGEDGQVQLWEAATGRLVKKFCSAPAGSPVHCLDLSSQGRLLATGFDAGRATVWDTQSGAAVCDLEGPGKEAVLGVAFSPDEQWLLTGSSGTTARLWPVAAGPPAADPAEKPAAKAAAAAPAGMPCWPGTANAWPPSASRPTAAER